MESLSRLPGQLAGRAVELHALELVVRYGRAEELSATVQRAQDSQAGVTEPLMGSSEEHSRLLVCDGVRLGFGRLRRCPCWP